MHKIVDQMKARTGHRTGDCGPMAPTQPQSWGAACPPGFDCTSDNLAAALNRQFAGERYGCRELAYVTKATADGAGAVSVEQNARVTICPTRVIVMPEDGVALPDLARLTSFVVGNQNQIVGDSIPLAILTSDSYQIIPFVTDCIKSGQPFGFGMVGLSATQVVYFTLIGPAIG